MEFIYGILVGAALMFIFILQYSKHATKKALGNNKEAIQRRIDEINASVGIGSELVPASESSEELTPEDAEALQSAVRRGARVYEIPQEDGDA